MKTREERIAFEMSYCQHYNTTVPRDIRCDAGADMDKIEKVQAPGERWKSAPCIHGDKVPNVRELCPHWIQRTREMGEARADKIEGALERMRLVGPIVAEWRKKPPRGKREVIECPACKGRLHLSQAASNGHVHGQCETKGCVSWME